MKEIIIIGESSGNRINPSVYELIAWAQKISRNSKADLRIILPGRAVESMARDLADETGLSVLALNFSGVPSYNSEIYATGLLGLGLLQGMNTGSILLPHTSQGRELAPLLAVRLQAPCISGVNDLQIGDDGHLIFSRAVYGGRKNRWVCPGSQPLLLTFQPGSVKPVTSFVGQSTGVVIPGTVKAVTFKEPGCRIRNLGIDIPPKRNAALLEAQVIVAVGRGIGEKEHLDRVFEFADLFPNSALAASRPIIDQGWLPYARQVGITGASVTPKIYIALGISGSTQHLAGIRDAECVIAVNTDPDAAIFNHADLCIVGDLFEFMAEVKDGLMGI